MADEETIEPRTLMHVARRETLQYGDTKFGFLDLVEYMISTQPEFNATRGGQRAALRIEIAMRGVEKEGPLVIEKRDLDLLIHACQNPKSLDPTQPHGYPISPSWRLDPYIDSMEKARPNFDVVKEEAEAQKRKEEPELADEPEALEAPASDE